MTGSCGSSLPTRTYQAASTVLPLLLPRPRPANSSLKHTEGPPFEQKRPVGCRYARSTSGVTMQTFENDVARMPLSRRVLVIDDEPYLLRSLTRLLSRRAVSVTCSSAEEALQRLTKDRDFDLVLCDVHLDGMSGIAFNAAVAGAFPELASRVVLMSCDVEVAPGTRVVAKSELPDRLADLLP